MWNNSSSSVGESQSLRLPQSGGPDDMEIHAFIAHVAVGHDIIEIYSLRRELKMAEKCGFPPAFRWISPHVTAVGGPGTLMTQVGDEMRSSIYWKKGRCL